MIERIDRRGFVSGAAGLGAAALLPGAARAQAKYPSRPVTLVCPWGAGGGTDATARIVAALLEKDLGQPFNVVNRMPNALSCMPACQMETFSAFQVSNGPTVAARVGTSATCPPPEVRAF